MLARNLAGAFWRIFSTASPYVGLSYYMVPGFEGKGTERKGQVEAIHSIFYSYPEKLFNITSAEFSYLGFLWISVRVQGKGTLDSIPQWRYVNNTF